MKKLFSLILVLGLFWSSGVSAEFTNCISPQGDPPIFLNYSTDRGCSAGESKVTDETQAELNTINLDWRGGELTNKERDEKIYNAILKDPIAGIFFKDYSKKIKEKVTKIKLEREDKQIPKIINIYYQGENIKPLTKKFEQISIDKINSYIQEKKIILFHKDCTSGLLSHKVDTPQYQKCLDENETKMISESKRKIEVVLALKDLPKEQRISETCLRVFNFKKGSEDYNTCVLNSLMSDMNSQRAKDQKKIKELELEIAKIKSQERDSSNNIIINSGAEELANELKRQRRMQAANELLGISQGLLGGKNLGQVYSGTSKNFEGCFYKNSTTSGLNKICYYNCSSGTKTKNIGATEICPLNF